MSMTAANATSLVRSLIKEATAKFWTDAEITLYLQAAMQATWAKFSNYLYELKKTWADIGTPSVAYTTWSQPSGCFKIDKIIVKETGNKLNYIHTDELWRYQANADTIATDYLSVYYLPNYTDFTSFPDSLQPYVCVQGAIFAKAKDSVAAPELYDLRNFYEDIVKHDLSMQVLQQVNVLPDFLEEESLEPGLGWTYKAGSIYLVESTNA